MSTICGYVAIVGRPNVGKSTLLNQLLQQKVSITSRKPQTTRQQILGIQTLGETQIIYVDTPGLHQNAQRAMNRYMNRAATAAIKDVDVIIFMLAGLHWTEEEQWILKRCLQQECPIILLVNKVDLIKQKNDLLPFIDEIQQKADFHAIIPMSAKQGHNVADLVNTLQALLPKGPHFFPDDQLTDKGERFFTAEIIREKLIRMTGDELPYSTVVEIEEFVDSDNLLKISAIIWVERAGQKAIVIGKGGQALKKIGQMARADLEKNHNKKVFLRLWVKVKAGWSDDDRSLKSLGFQ